jgi:6-pyruvoyltetrahydropterin/6-carboxytetrahydropterin synthase
MRVEVSLPGFSAAHFLLGHEKCDHVHGHNWLVGAAVEGRPNEMGMVVDFEELESILSEACRDFDHRILLPGKNREILLEIGAKSCSLKFGERIYTFPAQDVVVLPVENVTAEELARLLLEKVLQRLRSLPNITEVEVWVEESPGKRAIASMSLPER